MGAHVSRATDLRGVAAHLLRLADEMEAGRPSGTSAFPDQRSAQAPTIADLHQLEVSRVLAKVDEIYQLRRKRKAYLPADLFGEPGWDIMLDLFSAKLQNRKISVTSACIAADVPPTTGLRWVRMMEGMGILERSSSDMDLRVNWIYLSEPATKMMIDLFSII